MKRKSLTYLPTNVVDVCFVQKLKHQFVVNLGKHPNERTDAEKYNTKNCIGNGIEFIVHQLLPQPGGVVNVLTRVHFQQR